MSFWKLLRKSLKTQVKTNKGFDESLVISSRTLAQALGLEQAEGLSPDEKRRLLESLERRFESLGWRVERLGPESSGLVRGREPLRQLARILARGDAYSRDLTAKIRAVHEYHRLKDALGHERAAVFKPWPLAGEDKSVSSDPGERPVASRRVVKL